MKKTKKNLLIFMPFIGGGGVEKNLFIVSNFLAKKFNGVKILTSSKESKKKFHKKIDVITPKFRISKNLYLRVRYLICLYLLFKYLYKNKHCTVLSFQANIYCILICRIFDINIIVRCNSSPSGWYHNSIKKFIYKKIISKANAVIVNSIDFKREMENRFKIKVNCIFNPLNKKDIYKRARKISKESFFMENKSLKILNIGRLTDQKDQITILRAINILKNTINLKLIIMGRGQEEKNLINFINEKKLNKFVKIKIYSENPYSLINKTDIFVLSSKYEGLPNVLLEAATLKKFIISTKCPTGPREILCNGKGGYFFKIGDHVDLSKKIKLFIKNKIMLKEKILLTYNNLEKFDYNKNLEKYFSLLKKFMN